MYFIKKIIAELLKLIFEQGNREEISFQFVSSSVFDTQLLQCALTGQILLYAYNDAGKSNKFHPMSKSRKNQ